MAGTGRVGIGKVKGIAIKADVNNESRTEESSRRMVVVFILAVETLTVSLAVSVRSRIRSPRAPFRYVAGNPASIIGYIKLMVPCLSKSVGNSSVCFVDILTVSVASQINRARSNDRHPILLPMADTQRYIRNEKAENVDEG